MRRVVEIFTSEEFIRIYKNSFAILPLNLAFVGMGVMFGERTGLTFNMGLAIVVAGCLFQLLVAFGRVWSLKHYHEQLTPPVRPEFNSSLGRQEAESEQEFTPEPQMKFKLNDRIYKEYKDKCPFHYFVAYSVQTIHTSWVGSCEIMRTKPITGHTDIASIKTQIEQDFYNERGIKHHITITGWQRFEQEDPSKSPDDIPEEDNVVRLQLVSSKKVA